MQDLARLSLNQATTQYWSVREAAEGCLRAGIPALGLWRHKVAETGLHESARIVRDAGLRVSSLCRGGWFPAASLAERSASPIARLPASSAIRRGNVGTPV